MDIGERDPALGRVNAALEVGWLLGRAYGLEEGYRLAQAEINDRWRIDSKIRIFTAGGMMDRPTAAERTAARVAILREGHAAGFHEGRVPVYGCPVCADPCAGGCSDPERHAEGGHDV